MKSKTIFLQTDMFKKIWIYVNIFSVSEEGVNTFFYTFFCNFSRLVPVAKTNNT